MNDMSSSHSQDVEKQIPYVDKKKKILTLEEAQYFIHWNHLSNTHLNLKFIQ